jgi:Ca-activated chloride channel family protein
MPGAQSGARRFFPPACWKIDPVEGHRFEANMYRLCGSALIKLTSVAVLATLLLLMVFPQPVQSNPSAQSNPDEYQISVNVGLVVLPVVVTNGKGKEISGLGEDSFHVYEDGRPQQISFFEPEDVPVTVGLVIDNSGSMRSKRPEVGAAAEEFARSSNPDDQMFVVNFNQRVSMGLPKGVPFTSDLQQLLDAVSETRAVGNTALYDGVAVALEHIKAGTANRKTLIVISDGDDNASRTSLPTLLKQAEASNTQIYTLGVFDEMFSGSHSGSVLKRLARATGGKAYFPDSPTQIAGICKQIAQNLRHQYTIGYVSSNPNPGGKYHTIRVTASGAGGGKLYVSTRAGYSAPSEQQSALLSPTKAAL